MLIESLNDPVSFCQRRHAAWSNNVDYWLSSPLRHVEDVGDYICNRTVEICSEVRTPSRILDMGFGSAWLLDRLLQKEFEFYYTGLDTLVDFVASARRKYKSSNVKFSEADLDQPLQIERAFDIAVNAFSFLELHNLNTAMANAAAALKPGGTLLMSTIDRTFLILALSANPEEVRENLKRLQQYAGTKYGFQHIDLGTGASDNLEYPSVLYSLPDFIHAAESNGLRFHSIQEHIFTAKPIPKIYYHLEFKND